MEGNQCGSNIFFVSNYSKNQLLSVDDKQPAAMDEVLETVDSDDDIPQIQFLVLFWLEVRLDY